MTYLRSIHIKNYRSHKDTFIEFDKGVNCITGGNDKGKSNIFKALNTVIANRPSGDDYISHWGGNMSVRLDFKRHAVVRYKSVTKDKKTGGFKAGTKNFYVLINKEDKSKKEIESDYKKAIKTGKDSGCVEVFKSFGQGVPEKIKTVLNMNSINLAPQFDGPFLLTKSAPDVAKFYNKIVNLDSIDSTIKNINTCLKREKKSLETEKEKNREKQEELKDFEWIDGAESLIKSCEKTQRQIKGIKDNWTVLFQLNKDFVSLALDSKKINEVVKHDKDVNELLELKNTIDNDSVLYNELDTLYAGYSEFLEQKEIFDKIAHFETDVENLISLNNEINDLKEKYYELTYLNKNLYLAETKENKNKKIIKHNKKVNELITLSDEIQTLDSDYNILASWADKLDDLTEKESDYAYIADCSSDVDTMISLDRDIENSTDIYNGLFDLKEDLGDCYESLSACEDEINDLEQTLKDNFPAQCPLCGK